MRPTRIFSALLGLVLAVALPLLTASAAGAATDHASAPALAKHRKVSLKVALHGTSYSFYGKVSPKGSHKTVYLLRANSKKGKYSLFKKTKTSSHGNYSFKHLAATGYFIAEVKASNGFAVSGSDIEQIFKS